MNRSFFTKGLSHSAAVLALPVRIAHWSFQPNVPASLAGCGAGPGLESFILAGQWPSLPCRQNSSPPNPPKPLESKSSTLNPKFVVFGRS